MSIETNLPKAQAATVKALMCTLAAMKSFDASRADQDKLLSAFDALRAALTALTEARK